MRLSITSNTDADGRNYQEDRFVVKQLEDGCLLAVMDGHGGEQVSQYVQDNLVRVFKEVLELNTEDKLFGVFSKLNADTRNMHPGSTLSLVFVPAKRRAAYVAVLGDSPVVIKNHRGEIFVGPNHNARSNLKERAAAEARGAIYTEDGYLFRKDMVLGSQMARSLGDSGLDSFMNRIPEISVVGLNKKSFILVGSDGLFDPEHADTKEQIKRLADMVENGQDAKQLVQDALERETHDNITAIVLKF